MHYKLHSLTLEEVILWLIHHQHIFNWVLLVYFNIRGKKDINYLTVQRIIALEISNIKDGKVLKQFKLKSN